MPSFFSRTILGDRWVVVSPARSLQRNAFARGERRQRAGERGSYTVAGTLRRATTRNEGVDLDAVRAGNAYRSARFTENR